jgi:hypothetical protein
MMDVSVNFSFVIPAETPILTFPLRGGRDDCLLSRKRGRIEVRAAGILRFYPTSLWFLSRVAGSFLLTGFRPDETTSHSTKLAKNASKVAGYPPE